MKRVYWRPCKVSGTLIATIALLSVGGAVIVEHPLRSEPAQSRQLKQAAAVLAQASFEAIREERLQRGHRFNRRFDPHQTGLIGETMSPVTSLPADLEAKQISINPNFAAAVVDMLGEIGVEPGDRIAVGCTGSFPAFNVCVAAALETMDLQPIIIHSASSSQFGANHPDFLWLDMERALVDRQLISFSTAAATLGGYGDRALGTSPQARKLLEDAIERNHIRPLPVNRLRQSIDDRMAFYSEAASGAPIKAYINIGGGAASIRGSQGKAVFKAGLNSGTLPDLASIDSVASRFAAQGVPVIHMADARSLAEQYDLAATPGGPAEVFAAGLVAKRRPNRILAAGVLLIILITLRVSIWSGYWQRFKAWGLGGRTIFGRKRQALLPLGTELSV